MQLLNDYKDELDTFGRMVGIFIVAPLMYNAGKTGRTDGLMNAAYVMWAWELAFTVAKLDTATGWRGT